LNINVKFYAKNVMANNEIHQKLAIVALEKAKRLIGFLEKK
jgi:hypothetical protein